jgi:hypothetical protein
MRYYFAYLTISFFYFSCTLSPSELKEEVLVTINENSKDYLERWEIIKDLKLVNEGDTNTFILETFEETTIEAGNSDDAPSYSYNYEVKVVNSGKKISIISFTDLTRKEEKQCDYCDEPLQNLDNTENSFEPED